MLSFDHPWAAAALLLFLPIHLWLRHREPREFVVGGLQPFRAATSEGASSRRHRPLSYWLLLMGFLGTVFALMGPRGGGLAPLVLVDRSLSAQRYAAPWGGSVGSEIRELGSSAEVITHREIYSVLASVQPGRHVTVWTDLAPPDALPDSITWEGAGSGSLPTAVVLQRRPLAPNRWLEHHAFADGREELQVVEASAATLGQPQVELRTDPSVHPDWDAAFLAIWPDLRVTRSELPRDPPPLLEWPLLLVDATTVPSPGAWSSLPWGQSPTPEDVLQLLHTWPIQPPEPLDRRESLAQVSPPGLPAALLHPATAAQGQPPRWRTLLILCSGLFATAGWSWLPKRRGYSSPSAV